MKLTWNQSLATGIRQIDLQHQELIEIINELEAVQLAGELTLAQEEVLPRLTSYALFHFGTEEAIMSGMCKHYTHAEQHIRQHQLFTEKVAVLRTQQLTPANLAEFVDYLKNWLIEHIMKTDHEMAAFVLSAQES